MTMYCITNKRNNLRWTIINPIVKRHNVTVQFAFVYFFLFLYFFFHYFSPLFFFHFLFVCKCRNIFVKLKVNKMIKENEKKLNWFYKVSLICTYSIILHFYSQCLQVMEYNIRRILPFGKHEWGRNIIIFRARKTGRRVVNPKSSSPS